MAQEDLLPQIFAEFYAKANPESPSDNQQLNKIEIPNDQYSIGVNTTTWVAATNLNSSIVDNMTIGCITSSNIADPATFGWGGIDGIGVSQYAGWDWGLGGSWS